MESRLSTTKYMLIGIYGCIKRGVGSCGEAGFARSWFCRKLVLQEAGFKGGWFCVVTTS